MPGVDWIPGISQLKAGIQLITGDVAGAAETQKNFLQECPVVSQATSLVQLAAGDSEGALETQKRCLGTVNNVANGLPVVGHVKGVVHHICGDHEGGNEALNAATRTTVVIGSGAAAGLATGGIGAIPAGIAAGGAYDIASTVIADKPQGYIAAYQKVYDDPSAGNIFDAVCVHVGDGLAGYSGGEAANKLANNAKISSLEAVRDAKQQQLDAGMFGETKISTGEAVSMGKEINAATNKINTLKGNTGPIDLKSGNPVPNNLPSTSTGGIVPPAYHPDEKEKQRNSTENKNTSYPKCETQDEDKTLEELDFFKTHDSLENALKHDFYGEEEDAAGPSKAEKQKILQKFANETVNKDTKSLKSSFGYSNSTKESLLKRKNEFKKNKNKNQLKQLINQRVWLHVRMPKEFPYTGAILLNNAFFGLYHSVIRHYDEFADFIPNFQTAFQDPIFDDLRLCLQDIANATDEAAAKIATENYEVALRKLGRENYNRFLEVQSSFLDLQLDLYSFIQENVTYANYLGEGVTIEGGVRVFFKVKDKKGKVKVLALGVSTKTNKYEGIFEPDKEFGDGRPIRTIITAFIMSWDDYLKQKVTKKF